MKPLTAPQEAFARGVASGLSQAEAYRQAYPKSQKWTDGAVYVAASKLMANPNVSQRVKELQAAAAERAELKAADVLQELRKIVHSDIAGIMTADGVVKLPHELDAATRAAVASFKIDEYGRIEYKFWDKNSAVDKAMKHLGLFEKDNEQQTVPIRQIRLVALTGADKGKR